LYREPVERLRSAFWNQDERRVRALWRLLLHGVAMSLAWLVLGVLLAQLLDLLAVTPGAGLSAINMSFQLLVVLLATGLCARALDHRPLDAFGLHVCARWWVDLAVGLAIGVVLMSGIFLFELEAGWLTIVDRNVGPPERSFWLALCEPLVTFLAVGFYEELVSRGYHLRNIAEGLHGKRIGPCAAVVLATVVSASMFGLMHAGNDNATAISTVNVGVAGILLALGLLWTGELALPIGLHISWNFCQGNVFGFPVSGNPMPTRVFAVVQGGDPRFTGGAFGPEAGVVGLVAMVIGAGLIAAWVRLSRGQLRLQLSLVGGPQQRLERE
jgi:membrane protease YdiL (CAAX protease family)